MTVDSLTIPEFAGFPPEAMTFLTELRANNDRDWFAGRRSVYERAIKAPAEAFVAEMAPRIADLAGHPVRGKIFRIHRDVRFSKDKSPYNAHLHVSFLAADGMSGFYVGLEPERLVLGAGVFDLSGGHLDRYRRAAAEPGSGEALARIVADLQARDFRIKAPDLKRTPAPFDAAHPRAELLRRKGLTAWRDITEPAAITTPALAEDCLATFEVLLPLHAWLTRAVGPGL